MSSSTKKEVQEVPLGSRTEEENAFQMLNEIGESMEGKQQAVGETQGPGLKKKRRRKKGAGAVCSNTLGNLTEEEVQRRPIDIRHSVHRKDQVSPPLSKDDEDLQKCLQLERKLLNPEFELRKIFGSKVINFERGKRTKLRHGLNYNLITPRDTWRPAVNTGISMKFLGPDQNGHLIFKFEHNKEYHEVQRRFFQSVNTYDPRNISNILKAHAYHVDTRIQLSEMAKSTDDMAQAAELIEGALHAMEKNLHLRFNITLPSCRLPYKYQENRAFFILMFKHLHFLGQRACHRTALELCKRLFSLDTEDPLGVLLLIDFYAIKTEQFQWLVDFHGILKVSRDLKGYPNFCYSVGLAWFLQSLERNKKGGASSTLSVQDMVDTADGCLQQAILLYPGVVVPLLEKFGVQIDPRIKQHFYFQASDNRGLYELLCGLYVWRCVHLWKHPEVVKWLVKNVTVVMDIVEASGEFKEKRGNVGEDNQHVYRHVLLIGESTISAYLPKEILSQNNFCFDPLPPVDSVNVYEVEPKDRAISEQFQDLMQDLNGLEQTLGRNTGSGEETAGPSRPTNLQQSVTDLLDAMRDLLSDVNARNEGG